MNNSWGTHFLFLEFLTLFYDQNWKVRRRRALPIASERFWYLETLYTKDAKPEKPSFFSCLSKAPEVQQTEQQRLLGGNRYCKQSVMLPHDIVSRVFSYPENFYPIFLGEPGCVQNYWMENIDLLESLEKPDLDTWLN